MLAYIPAPWILWDNSSMARILPFLAPMAPPIGSRIAGRNGIGLCQALENRILGTKSRGVARRKSVESRFGVGKPLHFDGENVGK